ncbi:hypothetical protein KQI63_02015 [bacterium]|nr:hypothetical protein [bacterium]
MTTWIVVRIPGFYATVERQFLAEDDARQIVVCTGSGTRALVISTERSSHQTGVHPGMRTETIDPVRFLLIPATPSKYKDVETTLLNELGQSLPEVQQFRPGIFASKWEGGTRFIDEAVQEARERLSSLGFKGSWGIAPEAAAAEIAAMVGQQNTIELIPQGGIRDYLAPQPLRLLHDLGPRHLTTLHEMGVHTFGELSNLPGDALKRLFGPEDKHLLDIALHGRRREVQRQWRGRKRLAEDAADPTMIRDALVELLSQGYHSAAAQGRSPSLLRLTLQYTDQRAVSGVVQPDGKEHEGHWQQAMLALSRKLWTRRVRIAAVRLTIHFGSIDTGQLRLFVPPERQERERRLTDVMGRLRNRWGIGIIHFAPARLAATGSGE